MAGLFAALEAALSLDDQTVALITGDRHFTRFKVIHSPATAFKSAPAPAFGATLRGSTRPTSSRSKPTSEDVGPL